MKNTFFITGTDTGVGKTLVACALLHALAQIPKTAFGLKPLAAGCILQNGQEGQKVNQDALDLMRYSTVALPYSQVNPIALMAAKAPHIAAKEEGRTLTLDRIEGFCRGALMTSAQVKIIEGAGGWRVPLNRSESLSGLPQRLQIPVLLVVGLKLGCLNHALLTAEAIRRDGVPLMGWVANQIDPAMESVEDNLAMLNHAMSAPCLGVIPYAPSPSAEQAATYLSLSQLPL